MRYLFTSDNDNFEYFDYESSMVVEDYLDNDFVKTFIHNGNIYFVDTKTISNVFSLDGCLHCYSLTGSDCCCGVPYSVDDSIINNIENIFDGIFKYLDPAHQKFVMKYGWVHLMEEDPQEDYSNFNDNGIPKTFRNDGERCIFSIREGKLSLCAIHKYCIEHNLDLYNYKPPSCLLFPLDCIELGDGSIFIFGFGEETAEFSRWDEDYFNFPCVKHSIDKKKKYFKKYNPVYIEQKDVIKRLFSDKVYSEIIKLIEG